MLGLALTKLSKTVGATIHPPSEAPLLWMTGHLWCHASSGWAFLHWCQWGYLICGFLDTGHILWHQQGLFFMGIDSHEREKLEVEEEGGERRTVWKKCGHSVRLCTITCTHTYLLCIVTCAARAPPTTCCPSRGLFLSWEDACHCREIQQSFSPKLSSKLHFWWDFTGLKCHLNYSDPENCGEPGRELSMVMTILITWCCHQGGRFNLQLLQLKKKKPLIKLAVC